MSESNKVLTFKDFFNSLTEDEYTLPHLASLYGMYMKDRSKSKDFLSLPELDQYFTKKILYHPNVMLTVMVKKVKKI